jgi:peptide chain release factor 1
MKLSKKDLRFEYIKGDGPGGQNINKTSSTVRVTHKPTGLSVRICGPHQAKNKKKALRELEKLLKEKIAEKKAAIKKERRDKKIKERDIIRTYDFKRGVVKNHRTGKTAPLKEVMEKGRLELINEENDDNSGSQELVR